MPAAPGPELASTTPSPNTAAFAFVQQLARELSRGELTLPSFPDSVTRIRKALEDPELQRGEAHAHRDGRSGARGPAAADGELARCSSAATPP